MTNTSELSNKEFDFIGLREIYADLIVKKLEGIMENMAYQLYYGGGFKWEAQGYCGYELEYFDEDEVTFVVYYGVLGEVRYEQRFRIDMNDFKAYKGDYDSDGAMHDLVKEN